MSRVMAVVLVASLTLCGLAIAIFALGDRMTLVPPPDAVAEGLLRQLEARRYNRTGEYLASGARGTWGPEGLEVWWGQLEREIGPVEDIQGQSHTIRGVAAEGVVQVRGNRRTVVFRIPLQRERGLWAVLDMPRLDQQ